MLRLSIKEERIICQFLLEIIQVSKEISTNLVAIYSNQKIWEKLEKNDDENQSDHNLKFTDFHFLIVDYS